MALASWCLQRLTPTMEPKVTVRWETNLFHSWGELAKTLYHVFLLALTTFFLFKKAGIWGNSSTNPQPEGAGHLGILPEWAGGKQWSYLLWLWNKKLLDRYILVMKWFIHLFTFSMFVCLYFLHVYLSVLDGRYYMNGKSNVFFFSAQVWHISLQKTHFVGKQERSSSSAASPLGNLTIKGKRHNQ